MGTPEDWAKSIQVLERMMSSAHHPPFVWIEPFKSITAMTSLHASVHPYLDSPHKHVLAKLYEDWISEVKRSVPAERLLVFNVKEGWEPLCTFLGVPVPSRAFPRVNDGAMMQRLGWILWFVMMTWQIYPFCFLLITLRLLSKI